jgi:ribosomal protein S4
MRRPFRYCVWRKQVKMSIDPRNCFSLAHQTGIDERGLNLYQSRWKCKTLCRHYFCGDVTETTFKRVFLENKRDIFCTLESLESRVDNLLFRAHFASSIYQARKIVSDGGIMVNGRKSTFASKRLDSGDLVQVTPKFKKQMMEIAENHFLKLWAYIPKYLEVDYEILSFVLVQRPEFDDIPSPYPKDMIRKMGAHYQRYF